MPKQCISCCQLRTCRCLDASNIEPLLWTATALGLERLAAGCTQYLLSPDVIAAAPAQVLHSITCCLSDHNISSIIRSVSSRVHWSIIVVAVVMQVGALWCCVVLVVCCLNPWHSCLG